MYLQLITEINFNKTGTSCFDTWLHYFWNTELRQIAEMSWCTSHSERDFPDQTKPAHTCYHSCASISCWRYKVSYITCTGNIKRPFQTSERFLSEEKKNPEEKQRYWQMLSLLPAVASVLREYSHLCALT